VNWEKDKTGCLGPETIEGLVMGVVEGMGSDPLQVGSLDDIPENLLFWEGVNYMKHLSKCALCRYRFSEELSFIGRYILSLNNNKSGVKFEEALKAMRKKKKSPELKEQATTGFLKPVDMGHVDRQVEEIELKYAPYPDKFEETTLAADTSERKKHPIRFASADGSYVLREIKKGKPGFIVIGTGQTLPSTLIINNQLFPIDENGEPIINKEIKLKPEDRVRLIFQKNSKTEDRPQ